jgi:hypothetical protein
MNSLNLIKEEIFPIEDKPWIAKFFPEKLFDKPIQGRWYADCIYMERQGDIKLIKGSLIPDCKEEAERDVFVKYIQKYKPQSFKEILFFLDLYSIELPDINRLYQSKSKMAKVIESILEDSRGLILWHQQFEDIISLFVRDRNSVVSIRKGINAKRNEDIEILKQFKIDEITTLLEFINERMLRGHTRYPNIQGACVLYELLK